MNHILSRPSFPSRAIITAGMPYGNKELHFGHIGGVFVQADIYARFLRDRIGSENVIFISGTDCYGSIIEIGYEQAISNGFQGNLTDYVNHNHLKQKETLDNYQISLDLFGASALGETGEIHSALSRDIFTSLYKRGVLKLEETIQFYDEEKDTFLNGRQVYGRCPIQGCKSENAYADECSLGHQYNPDELINPVSVLSGNRPMRVAVKNWFLNLPLFKNQIANVVNEWEKYPLYRKDLIIIMREFLKKPSVYVKKELIDKIDNLEDMPHFAVIEDEKKPSRELVFDDLSCREQAVTVLTKNKIRYRTGKTLVPLRLSGNVNWGISIPEIEGVDGLTFWVWPESLWAPISFTKAYLNDGLHGNEWEKWWKSDDAQVYQFIGEDNIYFYGIAETGLFLALNENIKLPIIVPNHHLLYGKTKASSSSELKPPKAAELLNYYTPEQLRIHFMNASLSERSVRFEPKALLEKSDEFDPVLNEGNLVCNIFNRLIRSCFYINQKYNDGIYPEGSVSESIIEKSNEVILSYERMMFEFSFDKIFELLNVYLRNANKEWSVRSKSENKSDINQLLVDTFHIIRICTTLFHPIVPVGCEMIRNYLVVDEDIWNWNYIFKPITFFIKPCHKFRFLESRVDFFKKHPTQLTVAKVKGGVS